MLAIRMQRTGRKGHASFRVVVQDSRQTPSSGKFVALLGSYDPHTKSATIVKDQAETFMTNGAQPSERVAKLFKDQGIKLPSWVEASSKKTAVIRHADKLRRNRPPEPKAEVVEETPVEEPTVEVEAPVEAVAEAPAAEEVIAEIPADEGVAETPTEEAEPTKA